jgi:uncharacterized Zn-finger protein
MTHLNYKPHKCHICNKTFSVIGRMNSHIGEVHTQNLNYCIKCNKGFKVMSNCRRHMRLVYNVPKKDLPYKIFFK